MQPRSIIVACSILTCGLLILAAIGSLFTSGVDRNPPGVSRAISDCKQISIALRTYMSDYGVYPSGSAADIFETLSGDNPEKNSYLDGRSIKTDESGFPIDAWQHRIEIAVTSDGAVTVASPGKDGIFKNGWRSDDIRIK
jgi:hypothetical protein